MTAPERTPDAPRAPLHRSYTTWWAGLGIVAAIVEGAALLRGKAGGTLSEHIWVIMVGWPGALIYALLGWVFLYHFPWGRGRPLGLWDVAAVAAGLALWLVVRHNNGAPWP